MLTSSGLLYAMGSNQYGKLGNQPSDELQVDNFSTPKLIDSLSQHRMGYVACGLNHALALTQEHGVVYSWGCGKQGQLGRAIDQISSVPGPIMRFVETGTRIKHISAGGKHSLFLSEEGQVYSAGSNDFGQLGVDPDREKAINLVPVVNSTAV